MVLSKSLGWVVAGVDDEFVAAPGAAMDTRVVSEGVASGVSVGACCKIVSSFGLMYLVPMVALPNTICTRSVVVRTAVPVSPFDSGLWRLGRAMTVLAVAKC